MIHTRGGKFTASSIWKLLAGGKTYETYIYEVATEILTGEPTRSLEGMKAIEWGNTNEPKAAKELGLRTECYYGVANPKFFTLKGYEDWAGASPDGLQDGELHEIKCPYVSANHLKNRQLETQIQLRELHKDYYTQIQFQMMCTGIDKAVFTSYDPRFLEVEKRIFSLKVAADLEMQAALEAALEKAVITVKQLIK